MKKSFFITKIVSITLVMLMLAIVGCTDEDPSYKENPTDTNGSLPAPTNLRAVAVEGSSGNPIVTLTWTPVPSATYYTIYQTTDSTWTDYVIIENNLATTTRTYPYYTSDPQLLKNTTYYYKVGAKKPSTNSPVGKLASVSVYTGFSGITGISAVSLSSSSIKVTWNAKEDASKYRIYRGINSSSTSMEPIAYVDAPATEYIDTSLNPSTYYYYRIAIIDSEEHEGQLSGNYVSASTQSAPTVASISTSVLSESSIKVTWSVFTGASKYRVYRGTSSSSTEMEAVAYVDAPATEYTDTSLSPSTTYYYRISVIDSNNNEGAKSGTYSNATPLAAPKNLTATVNGRIITLKWDAVMGASTYYIYIAFSETGPYAPIGSLSASYGTAYHVSSATINSSVPLSASTTYYFKVSSIMGGQMSSPVNATTGS